MKLKNVYFTDLFRKYVKFKCNLFISFKLKKKTKKKHFNCHTKELLSFVTNSNFQTYII